MRETENLRHRIVDDEAVEEALHRLSSTAVQIGEAKAEVIYCEEYRKSLKAILMKNYLEKNRGAPVSAQEREAYAHDKYEAHIKRLQRAVAEYESLKAERTHAEMVIEAWRTEQANYRSMKL